jgi:alpha-amylase
MSKNKIRLALGIHDHQPVGNFEGVLDQAFRRCYLPFLEKLEQHPTVRISLHHSGCLLEWIEKNQPAFIDRLAALVERRQVEILGGGFFEPILSVIPYEDALEQLQIMNGWAAKRLGAKVRGIWLTERIWEPSLPLLLREAGLEFTIVDETHFHIAGVPKEKMVGYYVTERAGATTALFPIDRVLRYKIPFDTPKNNLAYLRAIGERHTNPVVTYADDGEKFGLWPDTYEWVYEKGWLESFLTHLESATDVETVFYSEVLDHDPPTGRVYVPTASYHEMMEWALPVEAGIALSNLRQGATQAGQWDYLSQFVRGGFWDNFLAKYPEANRLHKRMLRVSAKTREALRQKPREKSTMEARLHLLRGQCNCAYWHGLFGGLYLNYLRDGVSRELYEAENLADRVLGLPRLDVLDHDADGNDEVAIDTAHLSVIVKPSYGGSIYELVDRRTFHHLTDVLARRREIYHDKLHTQNQVTEQPKSPHEMTRAKEKGLDALLFYDWFDRYSSLDHFLAPWTDAASFATCRYGELGDFVNQPFKLVRAERKGDVFEIEMLRDGGIYPGGQKQPLQMRKLVAIQINEPRLTLTTIVTNQGGPVDLWLARQWNLSLLAGNAPDRWIDVAGQRSQMGESGVAENVDRFSINDEWKKLRVDFELVEPVELWHFPVETVSQSEGGFERTYQGTAFVFGSRFHLDGGESKTLQLTLTTGSL